MTNRLNKLYKKTSTGAIQYWEISTSGNIIITRFGQLNGKIQETTDIIKEGKNTGKINETTAEQQAEAETLSQWTKKLKKGYIESIEAAKAGKVDEEAIEGGFFPMLCHKFSEQGHKIRYPAYINSKLDGSRLVCDENANLWTRTRKKVTGVLHINKEIEKIFEYPFPRLDGELYNHDLKKDFEKIMHFARQEETIEGSEIVQYHVYDVFMPGTFKERYEWLKTNIPKDNKYIKLVEAVEVNSEEEIMEMFEKHLAEGYEGSIVRNMHGLYENKRSYNLLKVKSADDDEFKIVGIKEGRGKLIGHVGAFTCQTKDGTLFDVKMRGAQNFLKQAFEDESIWKDKMLTVKYQGLTNRQNVPRFGIGVRLRPEGE